MKPGRFTDTARALMREAFEALNARGPEDQEAPPEDVEMLESRKQDAAVNAAQRVRMLLGGEPERHLAIGRAHSDLLDSYYVTGQVSTEEAGVLGAAIRASGLAARDPLLGRLVAAFDESKHKRGGDAENPGRFSKQEGSGSSSQEEPAGGEREKRTTESGAVQRTGGKHGLDEATRDRRQTSDDAARRAERGFSSNAPNGDLGRVQGEDGQPMSGVEILASLEPGVDSQIYLRDENGVYPEYRQELHNKFVDSLFEGKKPPKGQPIFHMMGGGPASGKSGIIKHGLSQLPEDAVTVDPDEAKFALPEFHDIKDSGDTRAAGWVHEESSDVRKQAQRRAVDGGYNTVLDGTGDSSLEKLKATVDQARAAGHRIHADYVSIPTDEAVRRSNKRAEENPTRGKVPEKVIRGTHRGVSEVFPQALEAGLFDEVKLWDNMVGKGEPPRLILEHKDGKTTVHDEKAWQDFKNKALEG